MANLPIKLFRGDGTELKYVQQYYTDRNEWWTGYFDSEFDGWVSKVTGRHSDMNESETLCRLMLEENKDLYFVEKPKHQIGYIYDKSVVE